jgi:lauroyl/myristoyl acyltransferase
MEAVFRFFHFCTYLLFRLCEGLVGFLPLDFVFAAGRAGGELAYRFLPRRRAVALGNLRLAFGNEMSEAQLSALNREHFQLLGANLLAGLKASVMPDEKIWERVTADFPEERSQTGWVALISHLGNWEILSHLGGRFPEYRFGAIYQGLANPYIDRHLQQTRTQSGNVLFDRRNELLKCVRFLKEGGVVGVLVDQGAGYAGLWTPLFGRLTSSSTLAATLSIRTGLPVVPIAVNTCGRARWRMIISDPVYPEHDDTELLTAQINRMLEGQIRRSPADWLWAHKRWKPLRPHFLFARDQRRVFFPPDFDRATLDPFRILLASPNSPEEAAAILPALRAIKKGRPDTWLAVLTPAALADVWQNNPEVDGVIEWSGGESPFALAAKIRRTGKFDAAIFFAPSWGTALAVRAAGIPIRVGRRDGLISCLYNQHPREPKNPLEPVRANLRIAQSVGANINQPVVEQ